MNLHEYPEYQISDVNWIDRYPSRWQRTRLKRIVETPITDGPHTTPEFVNDGIPFVSAESVWDGRIHLESRRGNISITDHRIYSRKYCPEADDVYVVKSGSTTGKVAINDLDVEFNIWSPLAAIRCDRTEAFPRFVFYALASDYFQRLVQVSWSFGTQPNIGMSVIENLGIVIPTLIEQRQIASFLDTATGKIDQLLEKKRALLELIEEKRRALITRCVTRGLPPEAAQAVGLNPDPLLKPSGIEWLGDIPENWEVNKFSRFIRIAEGQVDPESPEYCNMILIAPNHIESRTGRLIFTETAAEQMAASGKYYCHKGSVLYSKIRPALSKATIYDKDCLCSADMYPMSGEPNMLNRFLLFFLLSDYFLDWSTLESERVAMPKINRESLSQFQMLIPPIEEQESIVRFLTEQTELFDRLIEKTQNAILTLNEYRSALITAAVTGKIDVRKVDL